MGLPPSRIVAGAMLVLALTTGVVFAPSLHGGFLYDDFYLIETNPALRAPGSLAHYLGSPLFAGVESSQAQRWAAGGTQYWRPFIKLVLWAQFRLFGTHPHGWHAVALGVHIASVLLAFAWLRRRLASRSPAGARGRDTVLAAAGAAALFALHPSRAEAVAWISGTADLWMGFWVLVGLHFWDRGSRPAAVAADGPPARGPRPRCN